MSTNLSDATLKLSSAKARGSRRRRLVVAAGMLFVAVTTTGCGSTSPSGLLIGLAAKGIELAIEAEQARKREAQQQAMMQAFEAQQRQLQALQRQKVSAGTFAANNADAAK